MTVTTPVRQHRAIVVPGAPRKKSVRRNTRLQDVVPQNLFPTTPVRERRALVVPGAPRKVRRYRILRDVVPRELFPDIVEGEYPTTPVRERRALVVPGAPRKNARRDMGIPFPLFQDEVTRDEINELLEQLDEQGKFHIGIATLLIDENGNRRPYTIKLVTYLRSLLEEDE